MVNGYGVCVNKNASVRGRYNYNNKNRIGYRGQVREIGNLLNLKRK